MNRASTAHGCCRYCSIGLPRSQVTAVVAAAGAGFAAREGRPAVQGLGLTPQAPRTRRAGLGVQAATGVRVRPAGRRVSRSALCGVSCVPKGKAQNLTAAEEVSLALTPSRLSPFGREGVQSFPRETSPPNGEFPFGGRRGFLLRFCLGFNPSISWPFSRNRSFVSGRYTGRSRVIEPGSSGRSAERWPAVAAGPASSRTARAESDGRL